MSQVIGAVLSFFWSQVIVGDNQNVACAVMISLKCTRVRSSSEAFTVMHLFHISSHCLSWFVYCVR